MVRDLGRVCGMKRLKDFCFDIFFVCTNICMPRFKLLLSYEVFDVRNCPVRMIRDDSTSFCDLAKRKSRVRIQKLQAGNYALFYNICNMKMMLFTGYS